MMENLKQIKLWGAATSAHQYEGRNHNQWSVWELENASELARTAPERLSWLPVWEEIKTEATKPENYVSGIAIDHYDRYEEDFDIAKELNLNSLRISIEWSRIEPQEGEWDYTQIEHYRKVLLALNKRGLEPVVSLWHFTLPVWFAEKGGFEHKRNVKNFVRFAEKISVELGELFNYVLTINEPNVYTSIGYLEGRWPPAKKSPIDALRVYKNLIFAHKQIYAVLKRVRPRLIIGSAVNLIDFYPASKSVITRLNVKLQSYFWNWYFLNRTENTHDFLGVNFYMSNRVKGLITKNPDRYVNDMGWNMEPARIKNVLIEASKRYQKPIMITENGLADSRDMYRKWWIEQSLQALSHALNEGANIIGYLHWSLMDNFEWDSGFWPRFGLVEIDRQTLGRKIRPSAKFYAKSIKSLTNNSTTA